ncbi:uncharacterized protein LOC117830263 [Xyrichtys novacula]|uniref:Uncharacterized protein LOC117830263 n=1 Tax=Xyrichtys novacula TaxID=13765 RepID=A0AAV1H836_XYRNO|nr:uncharacterized protein LOC117830263 [Xyrichtys novacula]
MSKISTVSPALANPTNANNDKCVMMRDKESHVYSEICIANKISPGNIITQRQEHTESVSLPSDVLPPLPQQRWSADLGKSDKTRRISIVEKKKEPHSQHGRSLPPPHSAVHSSLKRYSCPTIKVFSFPTRTSSSSPSTQSCPPTPVQTSVITGHDPLGWKLQPKSSSTSCRARSKRLSLQIPLPVIFPEPKSSPALNFHPDKTQSPDSLVKAKPPLRPKPRRYHSESSPLLSSLSPGPVVTLKDLLAVHQNPVSISDGSDAVFSDEEEEMTVTGQQCKLPPPVPEKTDMTREIARQIARSRCCWLKSRSSMV